MISSDTKKVFSTESGMLYEMRKCYLRYPHHHPEVYTKARAWVYEQPYTDIRFGTVGGSTINGRYYPSEVWFGTHCPDIEIMFKLSFPEIAP